MTLASGTLLHREVWNIQSFFGGTRSNTAFCMAMCWYYGVHASLAEILGHR